MSYFQIGVSTAVHYFIFKECYFLELKAFLIVKKSITNKDHTWRVLQNIKSPESFQKQPPEVFYEKRCSQKSRKIPVKHQCQSLIFNKVAGLRLTTLLKKRLLHRCFPANFAKFLRTPLLQNTSGGAASVFFRKNFSFSLSIYFQQYLFFSSTKNLHLVIMKNKIKP